MMECNCGMLHDPILLYKIPISTRKDFLDVYRQFGGARPSKGSPALRQKNSVDVPCATEAGVSLHPSACEQRATINNLYELKHNAAVLVPSSLVAIPRTASFDTNISTHPLCCPQ